jgi:hypothetical protein
MGKRAVVSVGEKELFVPTKNNSLVQASKIL